MTTPRIGRPAVTFVTALAIVLALALALTLAPATRALAGDTEDARAMADKATAAYALAHYGAAADYFEKAFELRPDPALLYNAAQAHRLAGNKERALTLYRNYLRVYAKKDKRGEIEARVDELEKAIAHEKAVQTRPPNGTEPIAGAAPDANRPPASEAQPVAPLPPRGAAPAPDAAPAATVAPAAAPGTAPTLVAQPAPSSSEDSIVKKPWFWVATGAGVAVAVTVILLLTMGGTKDPSPSIGSFDGN